MAKISIEIKGISPLLMCRYPEVEIDGLEKMKPEDQAEHRAYRGPNGELFIPGTNIQRALVSAAAFSKGKGRASLQKVAAACLLVDEERCDLGTKNYAIDTRGVVMKTGGRVRRHRPRLDAWGVSFTVEYDELLLREKELSRIVQDCGCRIGLLDFRPERKGRFGRFIVIRFVAL